MATSGESTPQAVVAGSKPVASPAVTVCTAYGKNGDLSQNFWGAKDDDQKPFTIEIGQGNGGWGEGVMGVQVGEITRLKSKMLKKHASRKDALAEGASPSRVIWTEAESKAFVDLCVRAKRQGIKMSKNWGSRGYKYLMLEMRRLGHQFTQGQLKNRWDGMQKDWRAWTWLKSKQTGLGWDEHRRTVIASYDWWERASQFQKQVKKFRVTGLDVELEEKYQELFSSGVVYGNRVCTPVSHAPSACSTDDDAEDNNIDPILQEGSGNSEEDLQDQAMFGPNQTSQSAGDTTGSGRKTKRDDTCFDLLKRSKKDFDKNGQGHVVSEGLLTLANTLNAIAERRANVLISSIGDKPGCSIREVMEDIQRLQGLAIGDQVYMDSCLLMREEKNREMYAVQPNREAKLVFLQTLSQERQEERAMRVLP